MKVFYFEKNIKPTLKVSLMQLVYAYAKDSIVFRVGVQQQLRNDYK